ncbi:hypothetical protein [Kineosporia sp. NBRC 101731]|uniref:hypothetical protein n=1 Tax=Kineosporia sp. NBRC 101731 TaxID=3032199 RepID=UPI0024A47B70|nr:hypothetical protein [Kineosporia sp. NBRC 101731]GLY32102.1 hypothetical protein Kisp02_54670 [Kineosporia sp. NBRC 101731]
MAKTTPQEDDARRMAVLGWTAHLTALPLAPAVDDPAGYVRGLLPPDAPSWLVEGVTDGVRMYLPAVAPDGS